MARPLIKRDWATVPLAMPRPWQDYFDEVARILGGSRNQVLCMALKFGGPIMGKYIQVMRTDMERHMKDISSISGCGAFPSEILGATGPAPAVAIVRPHERKHTITKPGARKPGNRQKDNHNHG